MPTTRKGRRIWWRVLQSNPIRQKEESKTDKDASNTDQGINKEEKSMQDRIRHIIQFFAYAHLPEHLQAVSAPFADLAKSISNGPVNIETEVALRKLLEAKDAAVRSHILNQNRLQ